MDHLLRVTKLLLWFFVGAYLGVYATWAMADYPAVKQWTYGQPTAAASASAAFAAWNAANPSNPVCAQGALVESGMSATKEYRIIGSGGQCNVPSPTTWSILNLSAVWTCPSGGVNDGNGTCIQTPCVAGDAAGYYATGFTTSACINGCSLTRSATGSVSACSGWSNATGWSSCYLAQNGQNCSTPSGSLTTAMSQCPVGQCPGTINGQTVCVACSGKTDTQSTSTKTITAPDGTQTTSSTTTNTTNNTNNTTSTTSTTTTTVTPPGGTPTTTTESKSEDKPKEAFCVENPDSPLCKVSTFGGGCGAFSCDGDAVQCAMAKEQHKRNCTMFDTATPLSTLGDQIAAGNDPLASSYPTAPGQQQTVNLSTAIDTSNPFATGCLQDKSFTIMTTTLVIPFSNICAYLEMMGQIVLVFSLLMAARIMYSGV